MTDRPIPFSGPMVRALLDGRKTQTRRVLMTTRNGTPVEMHPSGRGIPFNDPEQWGFPYYDKSTGSTEIMFLPDYAKRLYAPDDRLYVREHWTTGAHLDRVPPREISPTQSIGYIADEHEGPWLGRFRQGMHMPRWASRLTLIVSDVRVQRLQEISNEDCIAEGIPVHPNKNAPRVGPVMDDFAREHGLISHYGAEFRQLWDSINAEREGGKFAWDANPWVAAYSFRVIKQNIDQIDEAEDALNEAIERDPTFPLHGGMV